MEAKGGSREVVRRDGQDERRKEWRGEDKRGEERIERGAEEREGWDGRREGRRGESKRIPGWRR